MSESESEVLSTLLTRLYMRPHTASNQVLSFSLLFKGKRLRLCTKRLNGKLMGNLIFDQVARNGPKPVASTLWSSSSSTAKHFSERKYHL